MGGSDLRRVVASAPGPDVARAGAAILEEGGILVHPTSTVYGIGGASDEADAEVARLKGRRDGVPLLRIAHDVEALRRERPQLRWTSTAERLARAFWPGPLTLVLDDGTEKGLGVRVEAHPVTRAVLRRWRGSVSSTSLNASGEAPATTSERAREALERFPDPRLRLVWLDAGELAGGPPSTLLSVREAPPRILRAGAVDPETIEQVLGAEVERG